VTASTQALGILQRGESLLYATLLQLTVIVLAGRLAGIAAQRVGQAVVIGEIVVGILLGPSLFGWAAPWLFGRVFGDQPREPLQLLSNLGLLLLMFEIGLEFDFRHLGARTGRTTALRVAGAALLLPFALGCGLGYWLAPTVAPGLPRLPCALFVATAFSITALPVLGRILLELDLAHTRLGAVAISAAAINDVVGWLLLAMLTALSLSQFDLLAFALRVAGVAAFVVGVVVLVRPVLRRAIRASMARAGTLSPSLFAALLALVFSAGMVTYRLGVFAMFGGFMMGVILFDETELVRAWRDRVGAFVAVLFMPIYFTYTGLRTTIGGLDGLGDRTACAVLIVVATIGKLGGAYLASRSAGMRRAEAAALGFMMNTRGLMELVVLNVGLDLGVISSRLFTMLVLMAIVSTVITTPALRRCLRRVGRVPEGRGLAE
jgi:Kef-type K+ transport system membrane component KefB